MSLLTPPRLAALHGWRAVAPAVLLVAWGGNHFTPLLLMYRQVEGYSAVEVDLFFATYVLGIAPGFLTAGRLADRFGRRSVVVAAVALSIAAGVVLASSPASVVLLSLGRLVSGFSVALAMVVGTTWIKELSGPPFDAAVPPTVGARRASLTLSAGFGAGAGVAGALAQWAPWPTLLPYLVQIALALLTGAVLLLAVETRDHVLQRGADTGAERVAPAGPLPLDVALPTTASAVRPGAVVASLVPRAPWVFGCAATSFVIVPALVADRVGGLTIGYATLLAVLTLAWGVGIQYALEPVRRLSGGRPELAALVLAVAGHGAALAVALTRDPWLGLATSALLGSGYGLGLVTGLVHTQVNAPPRLLGLLTGAYYSLTYVGFVFPVTLAALASLLPYPVLLAGLTGVALLCLAVVAWRPSGTLSSPSR